MMQIIVVWNSRKQQNISVVRNKSFVPTFCQTQKISKHLSLLLIISLLILIIFLHVTLFFIITNIFKKSNISWKSIRCWEVKIIFSKIDLKKEYKLVIFFPFQLFEQKCELHGAFNVSYFFFFFLIHCEKFSF